MQENGKYVFTFDKKIKIVGNKEMEGICMEFYFKLNEEQSIYLLFAQKSRII